MDDLLTTDLFEYQERVFQQDGAKPHKFTARATMMLREKFPDIIEDRPPNSPDLNLIENLWAILTIASASGA